MEGTRHERAALVGVAYFLGFLTTFIWLGFSASSTAPFSNPTVTTQSASVAAALPDSVSKAAAVSEPSNQSVTYVDGVLEVVTMGETRSLSFNPDLTDIEPTEDFMTQGVHYGDLAYAVSQSEEYVFFCEMKTVDAKTCLPFVYDTLSQIIYPVRKDGDRVELLTNAAVSATWQGNQLSVGGEISPDPAQPWLLGR